MKNLFQISRATLFLYSKATSTLSGRDETNLLIKCKVGKGITGTINQQR